MKIFLCAPMWSLNGVNVFSMQLARGLNERGYNARILITDAYRPDLKPMPLPDNVPVERLPIRVLSGWRERWRTLKTYLEENAPCIYIPNHDVRHSCISSELSARVGIVGIVHSDDPFHYEHVARLGEFWNIIVAVSETISAKTRALNPSFASRLVTIPYGVQVQAHLPENTRSPAKPLRIVYAGRFEQKQKRILDLPRIAKKLIERGVPFEMTLIGNGEQERAVREKIRELALEKQVRLVPTLNHAQIQEQFSQQDVFLLCSAYEGLPISVLEAMAQGCIPVVSNIASGIPQLIDHGVNGLSADVGDVEMFAAHLETLQRDEKLFCAMRQHAHATIVRTYRLDQMIDAYAQLLDHIEKEIACGSFVRVSRNIVPPPSITHKEKLMTRVWSISGRMLRR